MSKRIKTGENRKSDHKICDLYTFNPSLLDGPIRQQTAKFLESILQNKNLLTSQIAEKKITESLKKLAEDKFNNIYDVLDSIFESIFRHRPNEHLFFEAIEKSFVPQFCTKTINIEQESEQFDG